MDFNRLDFSKLSKAVKDEKPAVDVKDSSPPDGGDDDTTGNSEQGGEDRAKGVKTDSADSAGDAVSSKKPRLNFKNFRNVSTGSDTTQGSATPRVDAAHVTTPSQGDKNGSSKSSGNTKAMENNTASSGGAGNNENAKRSGTGVSSSDSTQGMKRSSGDAAQGVLPTSGGNPGDATQGKPATSHAPTDAADDNTVDDTTDIIDATAFDDDSEHDLALEDDTTPFSGFDSMFEDLLSDDDDEYSPAGTESAQGRFGNSSGDLAQGENGVAASIPGKVTPGDSSVDNAHDVEPEVYNPFIDGDDDDEEDFYNLDTSAETMSQVLEGDNRTRDTNQGDAGSDSEMLQAFNTEDTGVGDTSDGDRAQGKSATSRKVKDAANPYFEKVAEQAGQRYRARDAHPEEYEKREEARERNNPKRDAGLAQFNEEVQAWEQSQGIERPEPKQRTIVHNTFAKQYEANPVSDVTVTADGVPQDYAARTHDSKPAHSKFKYFSKDKKMNIAEMAFFRATRERKAEALRSTELAERLLPPVGKQETAKDFRARARRITRALEGKDAYKKGARTTFGIKEQDTLRFLAMFRYATPSHVSRMFSEPRATTVNRLHKLRSHGLMINRAIFGTEDLWVLTDAGMLLSGLELVRTTDARMTFSMFPHQFTVNNTAAHLWGAGVNVLGLPDYPQYNKTNLQGEPIPGEHLISELEIQSTFTKQRAFGAAHIFRPQIIGQINSAFDKWEDAGGVDFGPSPEMHEGNEYMWTILPPTVQRHAYHVPDLVVQRDRNPDGSPNSLAVEIEIYNKPQESYERTLRAYASDTRLYKQVIWVCKGVGSARKLEKAAKSTGLLKDGRIRIVPILTEDGVFKGRDLWLI